MQKLFPMFSSQKHLNSVAQETRQVTLRFPLFTTPEADIAVHTAFGQKGADLGMT